MSGRPNRKQLAKEADRKFREALTGQAVFIYGTTGLTEQGGVQLVREYSASPGIALVHKVRIVADLVTVHAYTGLRVIPVDDEGQSVPAKVMDESGEVEFPLHIHSVRFAEPDN